MSQTPYGCTAADLATREIETQPTAASAGDVHEWLVDNGYDVAPIVEDGTPVGFVERESLETATDDSSVTDYTKTITLDRIIRSEAPFSEVLEALYESPFYFLGGQNRVSGILTRADLNQSPAYIHLFDRITLLEEQFRTLIQTHAPDWKETVTINQNEVDDIEKRYDQAQAANLELEEIHYAGFATLVRIVSEVESCWQACGFSSSDRARSQLDDLRRLRNSVAHSTLLIENTNDGLLERGRTIGELEQTYTTLEACLRELRPI